MEYCAIGFLLKAMSPYLKEVTEVDIREVRTVLSF